MRQHTLTVVARVRDVPGAREALARLDARGAFLGRSTLRIHFARLALIDDLQSPARSVWLVFESNFDSHEEDADRARRAHLAELGVACRDELAQAFGCCAGFEAALGAGALADVLGRHYAPATAAYQGHAKRDLARIRLELRVREVVLEYFERAPRSTPEELRAGARAHVLDRVLEDAALVGLDLSLPAPFEPSQQERSHRLTHRIAPWLENAEPALPLLAWLYRIYQWQKQDPEFDLRGQQEAWQASDHERHAAIAATEDFGVQNALTHVVPVRSGGVERGLVLKQAHQYIAKLAQNFFDDVGQLGGIPSIHFAKWLLIDNDQRLLFLSNYDGSWESYLGDFVDQAAIGLNLAWSCTEGYPATRYLAWGGAHDEERFKAWGRACQRPTQVFYSAYPELSVAAANNSTWIRAGLHPGSPEDASAWLRRLT